MRWTHLALFSIALILGGCAGTRVITSDVQAFSSIQKVEPPVTYKFERMPSQQAQPAAQARLEAIAEQSLAQVGMVRDDARPRFSVMVDTRVHRNMPNPHWNDPWFGPWGGPWGGPWHGGPWGRYYHPAFGSPWGPPPTFMEPTVFEREVQLVMRELATQQVVFESRAVNESFGMGDDALLAAMFDAALKGFPQPPQGVRRVRVEVPPANAAPVPAPVPAPAKAAAG